MEQMFVRSNTCALDDLIASQMLLRKIESRPNNRAPGISHPAHFSPKAAKTAWRDHEGKIPISTLSMDRCRLGTHAKEPVNSCGQETRKEHPSGAGVDSRMLSPGKGLGSGLPVAVA